MVTTNFKEAIKSHLDNMAQQEPAFAEKYASNPDKTIDKCCEYIVKEVSKQRNGSQCVAMTSEEVFGLAVHFYDEDVLFDTQTTQVDNVQVVVGDESANSTEQPTSEPPAPKKRGRKKKAESAEPQPQSEPEPQPQEPPEQTFEIPDLDIPLF